LTASHVVNSPGCSRKCSMRRPSSAIAAGRHFATACFCPPEHILDFGVQDWKTGSQCIADSGKVVGGAFTVFGALGGCRASRVRDFPLLKRKNLAQQNQPICRAGQPQARRAAMR
jgi:hypothetical protein